MTAYTSTSVPSYKSQEAIKKILQAAGCKGVQFSEDFEDRQIMCRFAKEIAGSLRTVMIKIKVPEAKQSKRKRSYSYRRGRMIYDKTPSERQEQMNRAAYRFLHYSLKVKFESMEFGMSTFESEFLSNFEWMIKGRPATTLEILMPYLGGPELPLLESPMEGEVVDAVEG
jgi:hypothetical protein